MVVLCYDEGIGERGGQNMDREEYLAEQRKEGKIST